jgi:hypothetical protein
MTSKYGWLVSFSQASPSVALKYHTLSALSTMLIYSNGLQHVRTAYLFLDDLGLMESFQPGLSFTQAEISARPKDKILLKHSKRLHDQNFSGLKLSPAACNRK